MNDADLINLPTNTSLNKSNITTVLALLVQTKIKTKMLKSNLTDLSKNSFGLIANLEIKLLTIAILLLN